MAFCNQILITRTVLSPRKLESAVSDDSVLKVHRGHVAPKTSFSRSLRPHTKKQLLVGASLEPATWESLQNATKSPELAAYTLRENLVPSSAPGSWVESTGGGDPPSDKHVVFYRDTNAWCPFCERVWLALEEKQIDYDSVYIDLRDKPEWYKEMVPTALVPAVRIDGELVYESSEILKKLEERFPETPLLPINEEELAAATELMQACDNDGVGGAGYKYLRGAPFGQPMSDENLPELLQEFEAKLEGLEEALGAFPGPYFLTDFSLVDAMYVPALERLAANLPMVRGFSLRSNPRYPKLAAWYAAMDTRPAYCKVSSDAETHNLVVRRIFGVDASSSGSSTEGVEELPSAVGQREAAMKLSSNHVAVLRDVLKNSGLDAEESTALSAEFYLQKLAATLADVAPPAGAAPGELLPDEETEDANEVKARVENESRAVGAATLAFVRNRVSAPRDMSACAAIAFRQAVDLLLKSIY